LIEVQLYCKWQQLWHLMQLLLLLLLQGSPAAG
jgi:hypothetical protein